MLVKNASSLETFKYQLKSNLFKQSHNCSSHGPLRSFDDFSFLLRSPAWKDIHTRGFTSSVGVQHGNTHSHEDIQAPWESSINTIGYKLCGSPAWKHTITQGLSSPLKQCCISLCFRFPPYFPKFVKKIVDFHPPKFLMTFF